MHLHKNKSGQRGQVIIAAIAVMFLLAFIAGIFLTVISHNIGRTARAGDVQQAQYLAEAGIRYADDMLTHSADGADWRPDLDTTYLGTTVSATLQQDPDYPYLNAGYTRFNQGTGRFLLRVSYQPVTVNSDGKPVDASGATTIDRSKMQFPALGKYIKIESIGRRGVVDSQDPTTWRDADPLHRNLVAYKPIGITDYVRFETNKDRSDNTIVLGATTFPLPSGNADNNFRTYWEGPIRVNGDLMWTGLNSIDLNGAENFKDTLEHYYQPFLDLGPVNRQDTVDVAGRIFHDTVDTTLQNDQVTLSDETATAGTPVRLKPSSDADFTTAGGLYRDGVAAGTSAGDLRGVSRLEPPLMDQADTTTGILRYRLLTRNSGSVPTGQTFNTGANGLGSGIYVNNNNEIQTDNSQRTLPDEWAHAGTGNDSDATPQSAWRQNLYTPPGAEVYLDPTPSPDLNSALPAGQSQGTIIITRHDGQWKDETGANEGFTRRYRYPRRAVYDATGNVVDKETYDNDGSTTDTYRDTSGAYKTFQNGVIFLEGNVRLQGKLPADWKASNGQVVGQHLTIVTNGTAYIEGNLLKGDAAINVSTPYGTGIQFSGIAVLAKGYVCVNSSAYFMKQPDSGPWSFALGNPYTELASAGESFVTSGYSAVNPSDYVAGKSGDHQDLLMLQTAETFPGGAADFNVAWTGTQANFNTGPVQEDSSGAPLPLAVSPGQSAGSPAENIWQHFAIPLSPLPSTSFNTSWNSKGRPLPDWYTLTYRPYFGTSPYGSANTSSGTEFTQNYNEPLWISRIAMSPLDIRIEAVLYAQEGSFFMMPGEWLNTNTNDVRDPTNVSNSPRSQDTTVVQAGWRTTDAPEDSLYPFYGEPADIRVVINGAVAENLPPAKEYQTEWAKHWGYVPVTRPDGSKSPHVRTVNGNDVGEGLTYVYDQALRFPTRFDRYNRPLPPMPALPVSPDLVFFGEAS